MNLLSMLLPGLRDLRTPFATGLLWSIAFVAGWFALPEDIAEHVRRAFLPYISLVKTLPTSIQTGLLGVSIYIVGMLLLYIFSAASRIISIILDYRTLILLTICLAAALLPVVVPIALGTVLGVIACGLLYAGRFLYMREFRKQSGSDISSPDARLEEPLGLLAGGLKEVASSFALGLQSIAYAWSTERRERLYFLKQDSERRVERSPFMSRAIADALYSSNLSGALEYIHAELNEDELLQQLDPTEPGYAEAVDAIERTSESLKDGSRARGWNRLSNFTPTKAEVQITRIMRTRLANLIQSDPEARRRFVWKYVTVALPPSEIDQRISEIRVRIKVEQKEIYDEYDRLSAESEFRTAIGFPLAALAIFIGYDQVLAAPWLTLRRVSDPLKAFIASQFENPLPGAVFRWIDRLLSQPWLGWLVSLFILGLFVSAGRAKAAEAARLLYATIRQGLVLSADESLFDNANVTVRPSGLFSLIPPTTSPLAPTVSENAIPPEDSDPHHGPENRD